MLLNGRTQKMFSFLKRQVPILGIDITSTTVKLLELSRASGKSGHLYRVESYAVDPLPNNAMADRKIEDVEAVSETIKRVVQRAGTKSRHAAVAVSGSAAITKIITMPSSLKEQEMETQINLEADQYIPYPLEEVSLDFQILGPSQRNPGDVDVLLAASRTEHIDNIVAAINLAGLDASIVDIEPFAMNNACNLIADQFPNLGRDSTIAIADVGAVATTINVLNNNLSIYTREQNFGGKQLTEEIQRRYGLSPEEAGMAKRQGGLPDNYHDDVLVPFMESMVQQINRALGFFFAATVYNKVDYILLAGGCASIPNISDLVEARLGIKSGVANPFTNMSVGPRVKPQSLSNDAPAMMIATGLALRGFDS